MPKPKEKPDQKKKKKPTAVEEADPSEEKEEQFQALPSQDQINIVNELPKQEDLPPVEEVVEAKYEEPKLTAIVVEDYEGEIVKGLFQGFGKAVYRGGNIYEGEFNLGLMNGKGKYLWTSGVLYEGDFLNNEITGFGVFKWFNANDENDFSIYEGQVYKGKRHGVGIFKSTNSPVIYSGQWKMGKRCGKGKMIYNAEGTSFYEGDWIENTKFGLGIRQYPSGNIYEGMWVNDIRHGQGTMRWFNKNQTYNGQWENGIQHGVGEHNWYLARIDNTQYALRNTYYGDFKYGKRHGKGTFIYASGAKYEGEWMQNLKHGWGKFTFKNGQIYEGYFEEDKMTDEPSFNRTSRLSQEVAKLKARVPSAGTTLNIHMLRASQDTSKNDFNVNLDLNSILTDFDETQKKLELTQAQKTVIRYLDLFKQVYRFYSQLGFNSSPDNTYVLNRMQFWRFLKDCKIHLNENYLTLMDLDRHLNPNLNGNDLHSPYDKILIKDFFNYIVLISYHLYSEQHESGLVISWCIEKLIVDNILPHSCNVQGYFYSDVEKTVNVLTYMIKSYEIYRSICKKRKKSPHDWSLTMRDFLNILNELKLIDSKLLATRDVVEILASDNANVYDSENCYNLELEMNFLEFFEALIGCSLKLYNNQESLKILETIKKTLEEPAPTNEANPANVRDRDIDVSPVVNDTPISVIKSQSHATPTTPKPDKYMTPIIDDKPETNTKSASSPGADQETNVQVDQEQAENINISAKVNESTDVEDSQTEIKTWIKKNSYFFTEKFFPSAERYLLINQLANRSL